MKNAIFCLSECISPRSFRLNKGFVGTKRKRHAPDFYHENLAPEGRQNKRKTRFFEGHDNRIGEVGRNVWGLDYFLHSLLNDVGIVFIDIDCENVCFLLQIKIVLDKYIFDTYIAGEGVVR